MTTIKHYSEAELLETYYMQPGQSAPVMLHLASCDDCIARFNRLEKKLREAAACPTKPVTFWAFQRGSIMRRVEGARRGSGRTPRTWRVAAAAALAFFLGGAVVYESVRPHPVPAVEASTTAPAPLAAAPELTSDPWQSEDLKDFHAVVQWESWVPDDQSKKSTL